jgi:SIR2-like domain
VNVPVVTPTAGVDPRTALATSLHAAPGVYAALVGSGMSSAAGIPTGWKVVQDLIRRIATAEGVYTNGWHEPAETWWSKRGHGEPRYDTLLPALAPTDAARQLLLRRYFDPPPGEGGPIQPTAAHRALADLCASGRVRVILTTNFDRLIERALDQVGISPQVVASPEAARGMTPLVHAPATVVKLHGDYASLGLRNTPEELAQYPSEWQVLLARVFDEYGLMVLGWSADYDVALADAMYACSTRRYPMFWTTFRGSLSEAGQRLVAHRQATLIHTAGADEFLPDLVQRIQRLNEVSARRARPTSLRNYSFAPHQTTPLEGWAMLVAAPGANGQHTWTGFDRLLRDYRTTQSRGFG